MHAWSLDWNMLDILWQSENTCEKVEDSWLCLNEWKARSDCIHNLTLRMQFKRALYSLKHNQCSENNMEDILKNRNFLILRVWENFLKFGIKHFWEGYIEGVPKKKRRTTSNFDYSKMTRSFELTYILFWSLFIPLSNDIPFTNF